MQGLDKIICDVVPLECEIPGFGIVESPVAAHEFLDGLAVVVYKIAHKEVGVHLLQGILVHGLKAAYLVAGIAGDVVTAVSHKAGIAHGVCRE